MNLLLLGACGRMGTVVAERAEALGHTVVCGVDLVRKPLPFPVCTKIADVTAQADVIIDFSSPSSLDDVLAYAAEHRLPAVLAATGYTQEDFQKIKEASRRVPLFQTGNLSVGVSLLQLLVQRAAEALPDFDAEIVERHHSRKKDAPSGTALMLAKSIEEASSARDLEVYGRHGIIGPREPREIGIHSVRGGTIVGEHEVMFAGEDEIVTLSHSARSRAVFANGALRAAAFLLDRPAGLYNMHDLLASVL